MTVHTQATLNDDNYEWANEYIVLFEAKNELIVLHRNVFRAEEYIVMTSTLLPEDHANRNLWCAMIEYHHVLPYRLKIQRYHKKQGNYLMFKAFFNMSVDEFFNSISNPQL